MKRIVIAIVDEFPTLYMSIVEAAKELGISNGNAYQRLSRLEKNKSWEEFQRLGICYWEDYYKWNDKPPSIPKRKTYTVVEQGIELEFCNEGCGQLSQYCLCDKFNNAINQIKI